jgi:PAS domain S-box-containing protein
MEIDDRKLAQIALAENESRHATALWGARAAFWRWQVSSKYFAVQSPLWFAMTGYTREEWESLEQPWFARIHPQDRADVERQIREHGKGALPAVDVEYRIRTASGEWKWMLTRGRAVEWDFEGHATCCVGVSLDIDGEKRTERALRSVELALDGARCGVWDWDLRTAELRHGSFYHRLLGVERDSGPCSSPLWQARVHPEDLPEAAGALRRVLEEGAESFEARYRLRHADGSWRWVTDSGRVCDRHEDGAPARMTGFLADITEHVQTQGALRRSEQLRAAMSALAPGFSFELKGAAHGGLQLASLSEEAASVLGGTLSELRSLGLDGLVADEHRGCFLKLVQQAREGRPASGEIAVRTPAGVRRWLAVGLVPMHDPFKDGGTCVLGSAHDITARKHMESGLRGQLALLDTATQANPDWLCLLDDRAHVQYINRPFGRYGVEDLIGRNMLDLAPAGQRAYLEAQHRKVVESGQPGSFDLSFTHGDAQITFAHRLVPIFEDGVVRKVAVAITDVSEAHRAQAARLAAQRTVQTVAELTPGWLALFDRQLRCAYLNRPLRGVPPASWLGAQVEDFAPPVPADRARVREIFEAVVAGGMPADFELVVKQQPLHCVEVHARPVHANDEVTGVVVDMQEVSGQRGQRDLLAAHEHILGSLGRGVVAWEPATGLITLVNGAFERLLGHAEGSLAGRPIGPLLAVVAADCERFERALAAGDATAMPAELECLRADGVAFPATGVLSSLAVGQGAHRLLVLDDAGARACRGCEIVGIVSHEEQRIRGEVHDELGQDLTAIALRLREAANELRGEGSTVRMDVEEAIERVNQAIERLRALARGVPPVAGGLREVLQALALRVSGQHGVQVTVVVDTEGALHLAAEAVAHVYRIVQEALTNVVRHSRATAAVVRLASSRGLLRVSIEDRGRGLPPGLLEGDAAGIGMMRCRARALRGHLSIESEGGGTQVRLTCPLEAA